MRGGQTRLAHITAPQSDFGGDGSKTDALHAMELALSFEKLNFQKLKELQAIAEKNSDAQMSDFVEAMLQEQVRVMLLVCIIVEWTDYSTTAAITSCCSFACCVSHCMRASSCACCLRLLVDALPLSITRRVRWMEAFLVGTAFTIHCCICCWVVVNVPVC